MITQARDAIRAALVAAYSPAAPPTIHIRQLPAAFARPAFYLHPLPVRGRESASEMRDYLLVWQLIYFPAEDTFGNPDMDGIYTALELLEAVFGAAKSLTGPGGEVFHLTQFSSDYRDDVIYSSIDLQTMRRRDEPAATLMRVAETSLTQ